MPEELSVLGKPAIASITGTCAAGRTLTNCTAESTEAGANRRAAPGIA
jgi:hypothetical protein